MQYAGNAILLQVKGQS